MASTRSARSAQHLPSKSSRGRPLRIWPRFSFISVSVVTRLSRHNFAAPTLAAPLLIDTRRSTVGSSTCEDTVTEPQDKRDAPHSACPTCTLCSHASRCTTGFVVDLEYQEMATRCLLDENSSSKSRKHLEWLLLVV